MRRSASRPPGALATQPHGRTPAALLAAQPHGRTAAAPFAAQPLGRYTDTRGRKREVIARRRSDGCLLVVDRDALTLADRRLVALLAADEPRRNAGLVCAHYLRDDRRGRCRKVTVADLVANPAACPMAPPAGRERSAPAGVELVHGRGSTRETVYRLEPARTCNAALELRWRAHAPRGEEGSARVVCLREVIGAFESYEPVCGLTDRALAEHLPDAEVSTTVLRAQLERMRESPIVLNRKLRESLLGAIERDALTMSEVALRCGRAKRGANGNVSGETSWLARRVGILPESGASRPTPWIHTDVLALIAREGLGLSPREVEV